MRDEGRGTRNEEYENEEVEEDGVGGDMLATESPEQRRSNWPAAHSSQPLRAQPGQRRQRRRRHAAAAPPPP